MWGLLDWFQGQVRQLLGGRHAGNLFLWFFVILALLIASFIGVFFVGIVLSHRPPGAAPEDKKAGAALIAAIIGIPLLALLIHDVFRKTSAKHRLGLFLVTMSADDLEQIRWLILSWPLSTFYRFLPVGNEQSPDRSLAAIRLAEFLRTDPLGETASRALFQRSPEGRKRYFNSALAGGRTGYVPSG